MKIKFSCSPFIFFIFLSFSLYSQNNIVLSSNITQNTTLRSGFIYELAGRITVLDSVTLTIEPGVIIKGRSGTGASATCLLIARGARIIAEGTPNQPIIFTSIADSITCNHPNYPGMANLSTDDDGLWGGLIILGRAPISASANQIQIEGIPASDPNGLYGGTDPADNSGVLKYISIRHGGADIGSGNEINGLTLGGVGNGTVIENIEVVGNLDDGIEFFGGTVNVSNVLILNSGDDAIDTDQAWGGTLDNFIVICGDQTDHALEIDGPEGTLNASHTIRNGTIKGGLDSELADFRSCARGTFENLFFFDFPDPAVNGRGDFSLTNPTGSTCTVDNYTGGILNFSNLESILPIVVPLANVFKNGTDAHATSVNIPTVGANICEFTQWTLAFKDGFLNQDFVINPVGCNNPQSSNYCPFALNSTNCRFDTISSLCSNCIIYSTDTRFECSPFTWIDGISYTSNNNNAYHIIQNGSFNGCDSLVYLDLTIIDPFVNVNFTANPTAGTTPLTVVFQNQTANINDFNFTWSFGDGTLVGNNGQFIPHTYYTNGTWNVALIAQYLQSSGCIDTIYKNNYVFTTSGAGCTHSSVINQSGTVSGCANSVLLSCNTGSTYTYQWLLNGFPISGANGSSYYPLQSGNYSVVITSNNCPVTSNSVNVNLIAAPTPTITASGNIVPCVGGTVTLDAGSGYSSYSWSNGATGQTTTVSSSGNYTVTVTDSNGCSGSSQPFAVNASLENNPSICIVGVDPSIGTNYNRVIWEKPNSTGIDSFFVYKETSAANVYARIGAKSYQDTAIFVDVQSNTAVQAYRYKITLLDSCGVESAFSDYHKSIHLTINQGIGTNWNLIWSHYEGVTFPSYNIYRGTSPSNMTLLTTIAGNLNSYTDINAPSGQLYYQIELILPYSCNPLKAATYNGSRSNIVNNQVSRTSIQEENNGIIVYPNPTSSFIRIEQVGYISENLSVEIYDVLGRNLKSFKIENTNSFQIELPYPPGTYYLNTVDDKGRRRSFVVVKI